MTPVPLVLVLVSIPLALGIVPRNRVYGFRASFTMSSDAVWYRANRIFAVAAIAAGSIWLLLQWLLPLVLSSQPAATQWADGLGWTVLGVAIVLAVLKYRQPVT